MPKNVKGIQNTHKILKLFEYLKENFSPNDIMYWTDEIKYKDKFKRELHFWREKTNSCGIAIGYIVTKYFEVLKNKTDEKGRFLILEATIDNCVFILINLRNPNTEKEQVSNWPKMNLIPETFDTRNIRWFSEVIFRFNAEGGWRR